MPFFLAVVACVWAGYLAAQLKMDHEIFKINASAIKNAAQTGRPVDQTIKQHLDWCHHNLYSNYTTCVRKFAEKPPAGVTLEEFKAFMVRTGKPYYYYAK